MIYEIANEYIKAAVNTIGAEPMSISAARDSLEYLWQGDPKYWMRRSPTLFPIVGMVPDNKYKLNGKEYGIEIHGFTKTSEFSLFEKTAAGMTFRLTENAGTLEKYPFKFELYTSYLLEGSSLKIGHTVINSNEGPMWFSIGEHPGFNCPLLQGETMEDYSLRFEKKERINRRFLQDGLLTDMEELFLDNENEVRLSQELFEERVIILKGFKSNSVSLVSNKHDRTVTVSMEGYPYLGIWSPETGAPFVCIEPWYGISSKAEGNGELTAKEGIIKLEAGGEFECSYRISID